MKSNPKAYFTSYFSTLIEVFESILRQTTMKKIEFFLLPFQFLHFKKICNYCKGPTVFCLARKMRELRC